MMHMDIPEYPKITSIFKRDPANQYKTFLVGDYATPELRLLREIRWEFTEKVDGTNIRIGWDGSDVTYLGRTDKAEIPPFLLEALQAHFGLDRFPYDYPMTLYGEGYGARIQKGGGLYRSDVGFVLFDVRVGGFWLLRDDVEDVAAVMGLPVVPVVGYGTLGDAVKMAADGFDSEVAESPRAAEGIVLRTQCGLLDRSGSRVVTKVKTKDFTDVH